MAARGGNGGGTVSRWANLTDEEVLSIVVNQLVRGTKLSDVVTHMHKTYHEEGFKKPHPYTYLRRALERGMLTFTIAERRHHPFEGRIRNAWPGLNTVEVVNTADVSDVADRAAKMFIDFLRHKSKEIPKNGREKPHVRVGLMGGGTIMSVCRTLAPALAQLEKDEKIRLPDLTFQALAVGDNVRQPLEDPASFFTYFADPALKPLKCDYVSLHAPVFWKRPPDGRDIEDEEFEQLRAEARSCDIVLVSAGDFKDPHSFLGALHSSAGNTYERLQAANCRGDLGRLPVSANGPVPLGLFAHRPCTLVGIDELQAMVSEGKRVILIAAPCGDCQTHKGNIIEILLNLRDKGYILFSDLICDSLSARNMRRLTTVTG